jgi:hypothetical protein
MGNREGLAGGKHAADDRVVLAVRVLVLL